jgi:beta-glucosidase
LSQSQGLGPAAAVVPFPDRFLWGAATSAFQVEGGNVNSDWWHNELNARRHLERSGDAVDSYHRYREDMQLLADAGLNAYRFGIEWARVEPSPGFFSAAALGHYRRMIDTALGLGLTPVVTLHHFTNPQWLAEMGGWFSDEAVTRFAAYVEAVSTILDGVSWVCTINEPNILALMLGLRRRTVEGGGTPMALHGRTPDIEIGQRFVDAHREAVRILRERTDARIGWTVAQQALVAEPGHEKVLEELRYLWEDFYLEATVGDDFVGVQSYTSQRVDATGVVPHPEHPDNTLTGWAYRPDALGMAVRHAAAVTGGTPILVTENGIATDDDDRRIAYTSVALTDLAAAINDSIDVRGYLHWSALDNSEWGHWAPTFGLIAVDRATFKRTPKPSLAWLGAIARRNGLV